MLEMLTFRKNKVELTDYDYQKDIENRLLMAQFSTLDLEVLEEILYSSLTISLLDLSKNLEIDPPRLLPILEKLQRTGLFSIQRDQIQVDKEMRKYFESQIHKFDGDFKPGMEFLQGLLRKVPMHALLSWYSIPRTSNNIFDSLVEKYFLTPQIFQRYLLDLNFHDPILNGIMEDVYHSPELEVSAADLIQKYEISQKQFEEYLLHLEFNFSCCLSYKKVEDQWVEIVTPFYEWKQYLLSLKATELEPIEHSEEIHRTQKSDFVFIDALTALLNLLQKQPLKLSPMGILDKNAKTALAKNGFDLSDAEICRIIRKACSFKLTECVEDKLQATEAVEEWLSMRTEQKAMHLHRYLFNRFEDPFPSAICNERSVRESEKSILRVLYSGWVYWEDFIKGVQVALNEQQQVALKRAGKSWKYSLPTYSDEERAFIKAIIFEWLFELGITATGTHNGKECFCVTAFGQNIFGE